MSQSRTSSPKKTAPQSPKALRPWAILAVAAVILLIGFVYFPLYNQPGLHTAAGFFPETETGVYSAGGASITVSGGTVSFPGELEPLTVTPRAEEGYYDVSQGEETLYSGPIPVSAEDERSIAADGTLSPLSGGEIPAGSYPVTLSQLISVSQGTPETRGQGGLTAGIATLLIWMADILFPNFFFKADPRNIGSKESPAAGYRKIQKVLWMALPVLGACFLLAALL